MKSVSIETTSTPLTESVFDTNLRFTPVRYIKNGVYKQLGSSIARCRDYFSDVIVVDNLYPDVIRNVSIYKYKYTPTGYMKTSKKTRLALVFDRETKTEECANYIVEYLDSILPGNIIYRAKESNNTFVLIGDPIWKKAPPMHSLYTLLINQAYQAFYKFNGTIPPIIENVKRKTGPITMGQFNKVCNTSLGTDIVSILINEFDNIFKSGPLSTGAYDRPMQTIHDHSGIVNLVERANLIKSKNNIKAKNWWGGDWSYELSKYI